MSALQAIDILRGAKALLGTSEAWTKGWYCVANWDLEVPGCKRCLAGALRHAAGLKDWDEPGPAFMRAWMTLVGVIARHTPYEAVSDFNDDEDTTFEDVHKMIDLAVAELS